MKCDEDDAVSAGDYEDDYATKLKFFTDRNAPKVGFFESYTYFDGIFPSLKIQKPGYDYYGSSTLTLAVLIIFIFTSYSKMSVDPATLLKA